MATTPEISPTIPACVLGIGLMATALAGGAALKNHNEAVQAEGKAEAYEAAALDHRVNAEEYRAAGDVQRAKAEEYEVTSSMQQANEWRQTVQDEKQSQNKYAWTTFVGGLATSGNMIWLSFALSDRRRRESQN